ncbi:MAG: DUF3047 domain-containing protein [Wenzhouxiangellaceae bacterium]|nr:DUF3047 domain-containing protein [Wenzhouxiangellaceae bacterium]
MRTRKQLRTAIRLALCCGLALSGPAASAPQPMFNAAQIVKWEAWEFAGETDYSLVPGTVADSESARQVVRAACDDATASGLIHRKVVDLTRTPVMQWQWRVDQVYPALDETTKSGDDYPARIYVVAQRWPRWRSRVINYVWSSSQPRGHHWPNAYAGQFIMLAVQSGPENTGRWHTEQRDLREDFKRLHDLDIEQIDAFAIMTDCDNAGHETTAWYGPIKFLERNPAQSGTAARD